MLLCASACRSASQSLPTRFSLLPSLFFSSQVSTRCGKAVRLRAARAIAAPRRLAGAPPPRVLYRLHLEWARSGAVQLAQAAPARRVCPCSRVRHAQWALEGAGHRALAGLSPAWARTTPSGSTSAACCTEGTTPRGAMPKEGTRTGPSQRLAQQGAGTGELASTAAPKTGAQGSAQGASQERARCWIAWSCRIQRRYRRAYWMPHRYVRTSPSAVLLPPFFRNLAVPHHQRRVERAQNCQLRPPACCPRARSGHQQAPRGRAVAVALGLIRRCGEAPGRAPARAWSVARASTALQRL